VALTTLILLAVTPVPDTLTALAPVRLVPVSVTGTVAPCRPELGLIVVSVGAGTVVTVNVTLPLVPPGVVTVTFLAPRAALPPMAKLAVTEVALTTLTPLTVTPVPDTLTALVPVRFVPVRVTGTVAPCAPVLGLIVVSVGGGIVVTVNVTPPLVPPGVVTVTFRPPVAALPLMAKLAVIEVALTTLTPLTVTPVPDTVIAVAFVRLVPVRVTGTVAPCKPVPGLIVVNVGAGIIATVNVTGLLVPPGVVTVTFLALRVAALRMAMFAVTEVALATLKLLTEMPSPLTFTAVAPVR